MTEKIEASEAVDQVIESVNVPSYEEVLQFSGLSERQFSVEQYQEYRDRLAMRVRLIDEQLKYFEEELSRFQSAGLSDTQARLYDTCKEMVQRGVAERNNLMDQYDFFTTSPSSAVLEEKIETLSGLVREIKFIYASLSTHGNFQSAGAQSSLHEEMGEGQRIKQDLFAEYSRYDLDAKEAQKHFNSLIAIPEGYSSDTLFFGSGMAAVATTLASVRKNKVLSGSGLYFENSNITHDFLEEERTEYFNEGEVGSFKKGLESNPDTVFVEPIGNNFELPSVDLGELSKASESVKTVILDVTLFGLGFEYEKFLSKSKPDVTYIFINSMQKLFQEGDSMAPAGAITIVSNNKELVESARAKIYALRGMLGTNITQHSLQGMLQVDKGVVEEYIHACVDNTRSIAQQLSESVTPSFAKVVYTEIPEGAPPVFYLNFQEDIGQQFIERAIELARVKGIQITDGASFGFRHTRLMCIGGDQKKVRICPGIENKREVVLMTQVFQQAMNEIDTEYSG